MRAVARRLSNSLGVLAKVDASAELAVRKDELAVKIAAKLHDSLNTVVPVSAAVERALDGLSAEGDLLDRAFELMRGAPADELQVLLADEQLFCELDESSISWLRRARRCAARRDASGLCSPRSCAWRRPRSGLGTSYASGSPP